MPLTCPEIREIDDHLFHGWPPTRIETLHGWRCALDGGVTRRPNSVWPIAWDDSASTDAAIDEVEKLYRAANLRPCFRISEGTIPADLDLRLAERGYEVEGHSHVLAAPWGAVPPVSSPDATVTLIDHPDAGWLACYESGLANDTERYIVHKIFDRLERRRIFGAAIRNGIVASVMLAVSSGPWVQISAVRTLPEFRRQGLAALVMGVIADWAHQEGAAKLILQVDASNAPALALYRNRGFQRIYGYHYRIKA